MPPPVDPSDEENSDLESPVPAPSSARSARAKKPVGQDELKNGDDHIEEKPQPVIANVDEEDEEEEEEDGDEQLGEEEYTVEKILDHVADKHGDVRFLVKWENYSVEEATWEPEENLVGSADEVLGQYLKSIGGREKLFDQTSQALKTKKRGRPSSGTPTSANKRARNGHPADSEPPLTAKSASWKPPPGSWEDHIAQIDACEDEDTHKLMVYLQWKNGQKTQHETKVVYQRCPQKMLQYYEQHVRIVKNPPERDSTNGTPGLY